MVLAWFLKSSAFFIKFDKTVINFENNSEKSHFHKEKIIQKFQIIYTFDDTKKFGLQTLMKAAACRDRNDEITHVVENGRDAEISPVVRAFSSPIIEQTPSTEAGPSTSGQMNAKVKTEV